MAFRPKNILRGAKGRGARLEALQEQIDELRQEQTSRAVDMATKYADLGVGEITDLLENKQAELDSLIGARNKNLEALQALEQRPAKIQEDLTALQEQIDDLSGQINAQTIEGTSLLDKAAYALSQSSLYFRKQHKFALEQDLASVPARRKILATQNTLDDLQVLQTRRVVTDLQLKSGAAWASNARQRLEVSLGEEKTVAGNHPLVQAYAKENANLNAKLVSLVGSDENLPNVDARVLVQTAQVKADRKVAEQLIETARASQNNGVYLRKLRNKQPSISGIERQVNDRQSDLADALFQRIVSQQDLQSFNAAPLDIEFELQTFDPSIALSDLQEDDREALQSLHDNRREDLNTIAAFSDVRASRLEAINTSQSKLLKDVQELCILLDQRLLWLPSTERIGLNWPLNVGRGLSSTITQVNIPAALKIFGSSVKSSFYLVLLASFLFLVITVARGRFKPVISGMSGRVGRVQNDSYLLTPIAALEGLFAALPWGLVPLLLGLLLSSSNQGDDFVKGFAYSCFVLSALVFVMMTLREWSKKGALFGLHYRVDWELRSRLVKHIPWLLVMQAVSVILIGLTRTNFDSDPGVAALGVLGFLIGAISISVFAIKLSWSRSKAFKNYASDNEGIYMRNEKWFFLLAIMIPFITSLLAAIGYFDTARLLLSRFFFSFCVLMGAYVVHGLFKRTVVIAQRRLALEQARTRRDQAVKARMEKVAAEERGEVSVPKLDYESIDLETINRQSRQLVNVMIFLAAAGALWALWSQLLPALSVFNDVPLWGRDILGENGLPLRDDNGQKVRVSISLWNGMQAIGIGLITWLAARNLPGFLEIFILKRLNMAQSSRFAIVTVLGYIIFVIGVLIAFDKLGTKWSQLQWIIAALGVGIGFGLQAIFANLISGLIILFERPIRIGDYITIGDINGTVTRIQIRATTLLDLDNKEILIPNQEIISQHVTNWTLSNAVTRLKISVGIAYGSDTAKAHDTMLAVIKANPNVLKNPEPSVLFLGFGDSTLDFEIRVFLRDFVQRFVVSHEIHMAVDQALRKENIEIAFPQRDLHIKNPENLKMMLAEPKARRKVKSKGKDKTA